MSHFIKLHKSSTKNQVLHYLKCLAGTRFAYHLDDDPQDIFGNPESSLQCTAPDEKTLEVIVANDKYIKDEECRISWEEIWEVYATVWRLQDKVATAVFDKASTFGLIESGRWQDLTIDEKEIVYDWVEAIMDEIVKPNE